MSPLPELEGQVSTSEAIRLRREISGLEQELRDAKETAEKATQAARDSVSAVRALRKALGPAYQAMQMIFGEISRVDAEAMNGEVVGDSRARNNGSLWQERIGKSNKTHARILQTLLDGAGEMAYSQIRAVTGMGGNTGPRLSELMAKNWVQKTGRGMYSLKEV